MYQVARIAAKQDGNCKVPTFNYDNVLEMVLNEYFSVICNTTYRYCRSKIINPKVEIIHSHGFFPYELSKRSTAHGIVLSSYEYMEAYGKSGSYARKKLAEQLGKINIIGNSITDYEEQKVFFLHHRRYVSDFSFLFTKSSGKGNEWMVNITLRRVLPQLSVFILGIIQQL